MDASTMIGYLNLIADEIDEQENPMTNMERADIIRLTKFIQGEVRKVINES